MNKNALHLFLFIGFISCNFIIKSMQPQKQPDISTFCIDKTEVRPVSIFFQNPRNHPQDFIETTIEKTSNNEYQILVQDNLNEEPYRLPLDQHTLSAILKDSTKNPRKETSVYVTSDNEKDKKRITRYSHLKVSIWNKDIYVKVGEDNISAALRSTHKQNKKPRKVVVSSESDDLDAPANPIQPPKPVEKKRLEPIRPEDFKMPYTIPPKDSAEDIERITRSLKEKKQEERDSKAKELLEQENKEKEDKNREYLKAFNLGFHQDYQEKISASIDNWDENPSLRANEKQYFIAINKDLKELGLPPLTLEAYFDLLKTNHIIELGSWHVEQYNLYNGALKRDNQPPLEYEKFHEEMQKSRLGSTEQARELVFTNRLKEMDDEAQKQLAFIKEINQKTERLQAKHDQYSTANYLKSRSWELSKDIIIHEGVIIATQGIRSLFPRQDVADAIESYDKAIFNEQREIEQKKEALSLTETKDELERKLNKELFDAVEKNQKILHPEGRKSKEELLDSFKKQRDKYVQK